MSYDNLHKHFALVPLPKPISQQPRPLLSDQAAYLVGTQNPKLQANILKTKRVRKILSLAVLSIVLGLMVGAIAALIAEAVDATLITLGVK